MELSVDVLDTLFSGFDRDTMFCSVWSGHVARTFSAFRLLNFYVVGLSSIRWDVLCPGLSRRLLLTNSDDPPLTTKKPTEQRSEKKSTEKWTWKFH